MARLAPLRRAGQGQRSKSAAERSEVGWSDWLGTRTLNRSAMLRVEKTWHVNGE